MDSAFNESVRTPWHLWVVGILTLLWNSVGGFSYTMTRLIPFQVQGDLADRFTMIALLEDVCTAANRFHVGNHVVPLAVNVESGATVSPGEKV